jgi:hypothetical protein
MKREERRTREKCIGCGLTFVFGAMMEDLEETAQEQGLRAVYGINKDTLLRFQIKDHRTGDSLMIRG